MLLLLDRLEGLPSQVVAGHPEGEAGRAEEDHLDSGAAEGEHEAEFIEEKESEETSGELTGPGER